MPRAGLCAATGPARSQVTLHDRPPIILEIGAQPFGGHTSNRWDGPAGVRGLKIVDVPMDPVELEIDLDLFRRMLPPTGVSRC
jgi:hypothetical protein